MSQYSLYFSLLPSDLLHYLFLYFDSPNLLIILSQLRRISDFNYLFDSVMFWRLLWHHNISSFLPLPKNPYEKYQEIFSALSKPHKFVGIRYLAKNGYDILLSPLLSDEYDYNDAINEAALGGHTKIVISMLQKGANSYNITMAAASGGGYIEIVKLMLDLGANDYNNSMIMAAREGHIDIVKLMLDLGANNYNDTLVDAAYGGHIDIVNLMVEKGANEYEYALRNAASAGHINVVKLLLELGANNYTGAMRDARTREIRDLIESYRNAWQFYDIKPYNVTWFYIEQCFFSYTERRVVTVVALGLRDILQPIQMTIRIKTMSKMMPSQ